MPAKTVKFGQIWPRLLNKISDLSEREFISIIKKRLSGRAKQKIDSIITAGEDISLEQIEEELKKHFGDLYTILTEVLFELKSLGPIPENSTNNFKEVLEKIQALRMVLKKLDSLQKKDKNILSHSTLKQDLYYLIPVPKRTEFMTKVINNMKGTILNNFHDYINQFEEVANKQLSEKHIIESY